jgi:hypothetical protein
MFPTKDNEIHSISSSTSMFLIHYVRTECKWWKETTAKQLMGVATKKGTTTDEPRTTAKIGYDKLLRRHPIEILSVWEPELGSRTSDETAEEQ